MSLQKVRNSVTFTAGEHAWTFLNKLLLPELKTWLEYFPEQISRTTDNLLAIKYVQTVNKNHTNEAGEEIR